MHRTVIAAAAAAAAAAFAVAAAGVASGAQEAGNRDNGYKLFMTTGCYECHGTTGLGGGNAGPRLTPNPPPLAAMIAHLRHPNRMPPYSEAVMTDAQIADIHAYLASIPPSKPVAGIPLLNDLK